MSSIVIGTCWIVSVVIVAFSTGIRIDVSFKIVVVGDRGVWVAPVMRCNVCTVASIVSLYLPGKSVA
jgi:hypothetical protein